MQQAVAQFIFPISTILISSLLKDGLTRKIIFLSPFEMYTLEYSKFEMEAHRAELLRKSKLDEKSFNYLSEKIMRKGDNKWLHMLSNVK